MKAEVATKAKSFLSKGMDIFFKLAIVAIVILFFVNLSTKSSPVVSPTTNPSNNSQVQSNSAVGINWQSTLPLATQTEAPNVTCPPNLIKFPNYGLTTNKTICVEPSRVEVITDPGYVPEYFKSNIVNNCPQCLGQQCDVVNGPTIITKMKDHNDYSISCKLCNSQTLYLSNLTDDVVHDNRTLQCQNRYQPKDTNTY